MNTGVIKHTVFPPVQLLVSTFRVYTKNSDVATPYRRLFRLLAYISFSASVLILASPMSCSLCPCFVTTLSP